MFDLGLPEIALIIIVALLLFGPKKFASLGKALGGTFKAFKDGLKGGAADKEKKEKKN